MTTRTFKVEFTVTIEDTEATGRSDNEVEDVILKNLDVSLDALRWTLESNAKRSHLTTGLVSQPEVSLILVANRT